MAKRKIVFINGKGGSGKTTAAMLTACAMAEGKRCVAILDLDGQGTATAWLAALDQPRLSALGDKKGDSQEPDIIIVDTPPRLDEAILKPALDGATAILIVSRATPPDLWTAQKTAELLSKRAPSIAIRLLFNAVKANTVMASMIDKMSAQIGVKRLENVIRDRQCYAHASIEGWRVLTPDAREEVQNTVIEILDTI
jgi:chromosome partitioning protein